MEVVEAKVDLFGPQHDVKLEPHENSVKREIQHTTLPPSDIDLELISSSSMWSFLLKRSKNLYHQKVGEELNYVKLTRVLLEEVGLLLNEVSEFVRTCCYHHLPVQDIEQNVEECLDLHEFLALGILGEKQAKIRMNDFTNLPSKYQEAFSSFKNKDIVQNNDIDLSNIQLPNFSTLSSLNTFNDSEEDIDHAFDNNSNSGDGSAAATKFSQYPRPKIVPVDYNKKKQVCVCEQCGGSWSRKEYYYHHKTVGKCTPKWIRYSAKNKNRIRCVHPDCEDKKDLNFTYAGIMKHIIDLHTSQETATLQCPDCPLKFPMKAVLKFHQDSAHQAHAMICQICGKIVRDMRKHKLVHSGEKPFQCDRCSYRCSRSGTLKRHMSTHLNAGDPPRTNVEVDPNQQPQMQEQQDLQQHEQPQDQAQHTTIQTIQIDQQQAIPIHIQTHSDPSASSHPEPKYIELNPATLELQPQYTPPVTVTSTLQTVAYRTEFKFP